ncbi:hypothetical protein LOD99_12697 [Oopsacas minuta]|uniref:Elongator complex protein 5 n=1 Tax=Oopsacas minuta TaxID=111878 RepID=A0AAV7JCY3_9METZ|nr:hypothetical protein LOD99_12697 [Oopsacas minuta]
MMFNKSIKLENVKEESVIILSSQDHNGFPLLSSLIVKYMQTGYKRSHIITNNRFKWESIFSKFIQKDECPVLYHELFHISNLSCIDCAGDLLVLDNASYSLDKFGSRETISIFLRSKVYLALLHRDLQSDSIIASLKHISPFFIYLNLTDGEYIATTLHSNPPRLHKVLEKYQISPSLQLTSTISTVFNVISTISTSMKPSSTFRLDTNEYEEAERTLLANPFLDSEEPVSQYLAGRGSSDSESDPDDDLNI